MDIADIVGGCQTMLQDPYRDRCVQPQTSFHHAIELARCDRDEALRPNIVYRQAPHAWTDIDPDDCATEGLDHRLRHTADATAIVEHQHVGTQTERAGY